MNLESRVAKLEARSPSNDIDLLRVAEIRGRLWLRESFPLFQMDCDRLAAKFESLSRDAKIAHFKERIADAQQKMADSSLTAFQRHSFRIRMIVDKQQLEFWEGKPEFKLFKLQMEQHEDERQLAWYPAAEDFDYNAMPKDDAAQDRQRILREMEVRARHMAALEAEINNEAGRAHALL